MSDPELTHINQDGQPGMVNVGAKAVTARRAVAQSIVELPPAVTAVFDGDDVQTKKGPVFQTAIIAGTMAAKKTSELIPLCHPIGLDGCDISIALDGTNAVVIATCSITHKTGVEMEALTAASVAALTIYDMCKGLSHDIVIRETRLLEKTGGASDFKAGNPAG